MPQIDDKLRAVLEQLGWKQADLARKGPFRPGTVSRWLNPPKARKRTKPSEPSYDNLVRLSEITGKPLDWWLDGSKSETAASTKPLTPPEIALPLKTYQELLEIVKALQKSARVRDPKLKRT